MGIKDLWSVLTPHADRKPMSELRGKKVAIDLAGWICESLNVVDYFVHPRHHLKNLFFRTCYLIWEEVTPVFVLEGAAPKLKSQIISKRNELQFRGTKPKQKKTNKQAQSRTDNGRTRFNHVLKQCEHLLQSMGIRCIQAPGEAEAYCAFLNRKGLVDGVISQDSDCFAYGAIRVYRNFSVSTQGAQAAQGGAVDIYDMYEINQKIDFGQHKTIVMALLCGCDYCPEGIGGVGRDSVLKLFNKYKETEILQRIKSWRREDNKYTELEMRVDDKKICSNCGHMGRTQNHTKSGCGKCRTSHGCNESLWKEERLAIKSELILRKKALSDPTFPREEIIQEFLTEPPNMPNLDLTWHQPNIVKFIKQIGHLLQWQEIYCFQKFLPILTRWQVYNAQRLKQINEIAFIHPKEIVKKRTVRGVVSLELLWQDNGFLNGLVTDEQLQNYMQEKPKGLQELWSTVEPLCLVENAYPSMVEDFFKSKEKPKKSQKVRGRHKLKKDENLPPNSLENMNDLITATDEITNKIKSKRQKNCVSKKGLQLIDKFFEPKKQQMQQHQTPIKGKHFRFEGHCSTPIIKNVPSDLESDCDELAHNMTDIINDIVHMPSQMGLTNHRGRQLLYEPIAANLSMLLAEHSLKDDLDLIVEKRNLSICSKNATEAANSAKRIALDDSFDVLVNNKNYNRTILVEQTKNAKKSNFAANVASSKTHVERFKQRNQIMNTSHDAMKEFHDEMLEKNVSYFFNCSGTNETDAFEKLMEQSFSKPTNYINDDVENDCFLINDSSE